MSFSRNNTYTAPDPVAEKLRNLKKTIKPDPAKLEDLTDENYYATWKDKFGPEARLQDFENVMDKTMYQSLQLKRNFLSSKTNYSTRFYPRFF